ncbi:MAG: dephospho-CoA kinase [Clostridia bacterium]|nr:dephospho-CoA kinase [Clostridia bacterium]
MVVIGLCGGSGSGKTTVSALFAKRHFHIINADEIYHNITSYPSACLAELSCEFGREILTDTGALNRAALRKIVFADRERLSRLNSITHRHVLDAVRKEISENTEAVQGFVVDAPLLFESGFDKECTATVAVVADKETRIARIIGRDGISYADAERRISNQLSDSALSQRCDYVIVNNSTVESLEACIDKIINEINNKNT